MHPRLVSALHLVVALSMVACSKPDPSAQQDSSDTKSAQPSASSGSPSAGPSASTATPAPSASSTAAASLEENCLEAAHAVLPLVTTADEKLIDHMPEESIAEGGGRAQFSKALALTKDQMRAMGVSLEEAVVDAPTKMTTNEGRMFAILPLRVTVKTRKGRMRQAGFLVGLSDDDGRTWKFLDGSNPAMVRKLKKFPSSLVLPEPQKPEPLP